MAGVFEVLSSQPSAFGEREESALEALSQRVLRNLERASEPLSASVGSAESAHSVVESFSATSHAASDGNQGSLHQPLLEPASEAASGRGMNFMTLVLGAAVLAYAVLMTVLVAQRLGGGKAPARKQPAAVSAPLARAEPRLTGTGSGVPRAAVSAVSSGSESGGSSSSSTQPSASATIPATSGPVRTTVTPPPAGSLLVYENGKEVFRMLPTMEGGEATAPTGTNGNAATSTDGPEMRHAPAVEPAVILEVPAEVAEGSLLHRVEPAYPEEARQQQIQGAVVLEVHIGPDGGVQEVTRLSGPELLAQAATGAVKQWRFKPRLVSGRPTEMKTRITLNFRLPR